VIALSIGLAVGAVIGSGLTHVVTKLPTRKPEPIIEVSNEDRDLIEVNFAAHINHLQGEVSDFADRLAGDDPLLRERLRAFEWGGRR
jgi:large-conductance mechanosensitive channel